MEKQRGQGMGTGGPAQNDGGASFCYCSVCGFKMEHDRGVPCAKIDCPKCGAKMTGVDITKFQIESFDPSKSTDVQIADDFRLLAAKYATMKEGGKTEFEKIEQIVEFTEKLLKEIYKRGVITFHPASMKELSFELLQTAARAIVKEKIIIENTQDFMDAKITVHLTAKQFDFTQPRILEDKEGNQAGIIRFDKGKKINLMQFDEMEKEHGLTDQERKEKFGDMKSLYAHKVRDFITFGKQVKKADKDEFKLTGSTSENEEHRHRFSISEDGEGETSTNENHKHDISDFKVIQNDGHYHVLELVRKQMRDPDKVLDEMAKAPERIVLIPKYISITGSTIWAKDRNPNDVDIIIRDEPERIDSGMWLKLTRLVSKIFGKDKDAHLVSEMKGPNWDHVPWYDLALIRKEEMIKENVDSKEWKDAFYKQRAASPEVQAQAETSSKEDRVKLFRFFIPAKPVRGYTEDEEQTIQNFLDKFKPENFPVFSEKKYDGVNIEIHQSGDRVQIWSEDGEDNTQSLPWIVEAVKNLKAESLILLAELEIWREQTHLPREAVAGFLREKNSQDDPGLVANVYDIVYHDGKDVHSLPYAERVKLKDKLNMGQATFSAPNTSIKLNNSPHLRSKNLKELEEHTHRLRAFEGSEGNVAKFHDFKYDLSGGREGMIKFHNSAKLNGIVSKRTETKTKGVFNYDYALAIGDKKPRAGATIEINNKPYFNVGTSFSTDQKFEIGDIAVIEYETFNLENHDSEFVVSAWAPRFMGKSDKKIPDAVDEVVKEAKRNMVLQEKVVKDGQTFYKQDPFLTYPDEDKKWEYVIQHHYRGKSCHSDLRLEQKDRLMGWTLFDSVAEEIKESIESMSEARSADRDTDNWKVDWNRGKFKIREIRGGTTRPADIRSTQKKPEPLAWLKVEGVVPKGEVGATKEFPGVFTIIDEGTVEYGAQKPFFHEYFMDGKKLKGRLLFRKLGVKEMEKSHPEVFAELQKQTLPPGKEEPMQREPFFWVAIQPIEQTPNVLAKSAVEKKFIPPFGVSALPKRLRDNVPENLRYWKTRDRGKALAQRDELAEFEELGGVKLQKKEFDFWYLRHWFRGQVVVRFGPSTEMFRLVMEDNGKGQWILDHDIIKNRQVGAVQDKLKDSSVLEIPTGQTKEYDPGSEYNPTKNTPAFMTMLDKGKVQVLEDGADFKKLHFKGKELNMLLTFRRDDPESDLWVVEKSEAAPEVKILKEFAFCKIDDEKRMAYGIVYEEDVIDTQGDWATREDIEKAAHRFMETLGSMSDMHQRMLSRRDAVPVESLCVEPGDIFKGQKFARFAWVVGSKIYNNTIWDKIKSGEYGGYSMEGSAKG